jgi:hypothetical protein
LAAIANQRDYSLVYLDQKRFRSFGTETYYVLSVESAKPDSMGSIFGLI